MKVLFVDVDGVLAPLGVKPVHRPFSRKWWISQIGAVPVQQLNRAAADSAVVLTSIWRVMMERLELHRVLVKAGFRGEFHQYAVTMQWRGLYRDYETIAWLRRFGGPVTGLCCVVGEQAYAHWDPNSVLKPFVVVPNQCTGMDEEDRKRVLDTLGQRIRVESRGRTEVEIRNDG